MTETAPEPQEGAGRTRVQLALITAAVPVVLAAFGLAPRLIGGDEPPVGAAVSAAAGITTGAADAAAPPRPTEATSRPKRWKITGNLEAQDGTGPLRAGLHLMPIEHGRETSTDDSGRFMFDDVPPGAYCLLVRTDDGGNGHYLKLIIEKRSNEPMEVVSVPAPLQLAILEK